MKIPKIVVLLWGISAWAQADTVVLVHGFLGNASSFGNVSQALKRSGWQPAGMIMAKSPQRLSLMLSNMKTRKRFVAVGLPSYAPINYQSEMLGLAIQHIIGIFPKEKIHLVAHSAGGIVARLLLVKNYQPQIKSLITIATPHLGTRRAEMASDMTDLPFPMSFMAETMGGEVYDEFQKAGRFFNNLSRPRPGNFLYWLNNQPHPPIDYVAIVHRKKSFLNKDFMVPAYSQSMQGVPALVGSSHTIAIAGQHRLSRKDGNIVVRLLAAYQ